MTTGLLSNVVEHTDFVAVIKFGAFTAFGPDHGGEEVSIKDLEATAVKKRVD